MESQPPSYYDSSLSLNWYLSSPSPTVHSKHSSPLAVTSPGLVAFLETWPKPLSKGVWILNNNTFLHWTLLHISIQSYNGWGNIASVLHILYSSGFFLHLFRITHKGHLFLPQGLKSHKSRVFHFLTPKWLLKSEGQGRTTEILFSKIIFL